LHKTVVNLGSSTYIQVIQFCYRPTTELEF